MPVLFLTHGSPLWIQDPTLKAELHAWGRELPQPKALLVISAHWQTPQLTLGERGRHHQLIYDFSGFPPELYQLQYPAPGALELATRLGQLLGFPLAQDSSRGLDHGVWVPLYHLWPEAEVPLLQLSLPDWKPAEIFALGQDLAPLRQEGVLIIASGSTTHNLRELNWAEEAEPKGWALEFDQWVKEVVETKDLASLLAWEQKAPQAQRAHPTIEHFTPLLISAGAGWNSPVRFPITGFAYGALSKRMIQWG